jgi:hypothetical protein
VKRGVENSAIDNNCVVMRGAKPKLANMPPIDDSDFVFSTEDKEESPPSISVYIEGLTSAVQVFNIVPGIKYVGFLPKKEILSLKIEHENPIIDVFWKQSYHPEYPQIDTRPGADGHAGIMGLHIPQGDGKIAKRSRTNLRVALAKIAMKYPVRMVGGGTEPAVE